MAQLRKQRARRRLTSKLKRAAAALAGVLVGWVVYYLFERKECEEGQEPLPDGLCRIHPTDALYLTVVTISTVGYGDDWSYPTTAGMRVFSIFYILIGVTFVFAQLAALFAGALEAFTHFAKKGFHFLDGTEDAIDTTGDGKADTHVSGTA